MDQLTADLEFTLHAAGADVAVRLRRFAERWVAHAGGRVAVGPTPRAALSAAVHVYAASQREQLMADLALLEPSVAIASLERSASHRR